MSKEDNDSSDTRPCLVVRSDPLLASLKTVSWISLDFGDGAKFFKDSLNTFLNCYLFILNSPFRYSVFLETYS